MFVQQLSHDGGNDLALFKTGKITSSLTVWQQEHFVNSITLSKLAAVIPRLIMFDLIRCYSQPITEPGLDCRND